MNCNNLILCLFGISTCLVASTVAIVGGTKEYNINQFAYQVSIQVRGQNNVCGGSIIGDRSILTAARCVLNRQRQLRDKNINVVAGTGNLNKTESPAVTVSVVKVFFPKEYNPTTDFSTGDISVLQLKNKLGLSEPHRRNLMLVKLPPVGERDFGGETAKIAGFGLQKANIVINTWFSKQNQTTYQLASADVGIFSHHQCINVYPRATSRVKQFCARIKKVGRDPRGACNGDEGSALVREGTVIGILNTIAANCDETHLPGVYTRVSAYLTLITDAWDITSSSTTSVRIA